MRFLIMLLRFQIFWVHRRRNLPRRGKANGKVQVELMVREGFFHGNAAAAVRIFVGSNLRYGVGITTMAHQMKTVAVVTVVDVVVGNNNIMGEGVGAANAVAVYFFVGR
ncbi:hypothetical protein V8G54_007610 [Vigna mungo]|uniref:Uncharacterized protein n=1 Tax=Vigna mungo TaxID=3915 RepID=A0AAQ3P5R6_VIGMU